MAVDLLQSIIHISSVCLNRERYHRNDTIPSVVPNLVLGISILQSTHIFLVMCKGGHNQGEHCRVLTDDLGLPTGKNKLLERCLEIKRTLLICELLHICSLYINKKTFINKNHSCSCCICCYWNLD